MLEPIKSLSVDVIPQAVLDLPVAQVVGKLTHVRSGVDDLDYFEGAEFKLNSWLEIAVRHYRGHPENTATIYIDSRETDVNKITYLIRIILEDLHIPNEALRWQRKDNPDC